MNFLIEKELALRVSTAVVFLVSLQSPQGEILKACGVGPLGEERGKQPNGKRKDEPHNTAPPAADAGERPGEGRIRAPQNHGFRNYRPLPPLYRLYPPLIKVFPLIQGGFFFLLKQKMYQGLNVK